MKKFSIAFINSGFTGKLIGGIMILFCIILFCAAITVAALVIVSPGNIKPVCDENGNVIEGSIAEKVHTEINGTDMGMIIKSKDISNPVLLFIHGGPGMPEYFLTEDYLKKINAPVKGFYLFEDSAHSPIFEEPEKVMDIMMKDVINGRNQMADVK